MLMIRLVTILATLAVALSVPVREHTRQSRAGRAAMALVAEAAALCEIGQLGARATDPGAVAARRGAGLEALAAAVELAERLRDRAVAAPIEEIAEAVRSGCGVAAANRGARGGRLETESAIDRQQLIEPFLARLNRAAAEAARSGVPPIAVPATGRASLPAVAAQAQAERPTPRADSSAPRPPETARGTGLSGESSELVPQAPSVPTASKAPSSVVRRESEEPPAIQVSIGASREHRRRVSRWVLLFGREAEALRVARRDLQAEIETRTMARSHDACRTFGRALDRVSPELTGAAPYRGIAQRAVGMLSNYRRGIRECERGRTAAAFSYLSEGDRAWVSLVRDSRRIARPQPARRKP